MAGIRLPVVIAAVVLADQAAKWWAWRHVDGVLINSGGYILLGPTVRSWFAHPVGGAVFDVVGVAALIVAGWWLIRRPRRTVLLGGGLIIGGWTSNILDRLGLHNWTAPGSARGVVDFVPDGTPGRSNTADLCIAIGSVVLGASLLFRHGERPPTAPRRPGIRACDDAENPRWHALVHNNRDVSPRRRGRAEARGNRNGSRDGDSGGCDEIRCQRASSQHGCYDISNDLHGALPGPLRLLAVVLPGILP